MSVLVMIEDWLKQDFKLLHIKSIIQTERSTLPPHHLRRDSSQLVAKRV